MQDTRCRVANLLACSALPLVLARTRPFGFAARMGYSSSTRQLVNSSTKNHVHRNSMYIYRYSGWPPDATLAYGMAAACAHRVGVGVALFAGR